MKTLLTAQNVSKSFRQASGGRLQVLKDISLLLHAGEVVCLLGPSGSGKTTLLQILAGLDRQSTGAVQSDIKRPGPKLGYLTQADRLLPWRTVYDNVALGPELLGQPLDNVLPLLEAVGLKDFTSSYPEQISGGMSQRALLARMLATNPTLLLLDEPMSNLDILARRQMAKILRGYVKKTKASALVVTHSVEEAVFLADRIILITRSPATLYKEISGSFTLDTVMSALVKALEGKKL